MKPKKIILNNVKIKNNFFKNFIFILFATLYKKHKYFIKKSLKELKNIMGEKC